MEVPLAVIAVTTAVKDIFEVGQKIHESFAKVSENFRNAERVAEDIKAMVEEIEAFCHDHKDAFEDMKDFRLAVQGLLGKFQSFSASILPLLPQTGGRRRDRFIRGWDAWRNNNKIEGSIIDLQSDTVKFIRKFMMKSAMRTEVRLETIRQETSRGLEVLEVVRRDVSALRLTTGANMPHCSHKSSGTTDDEFNRNVIMFAQSTRSTSAPMLRTPDVITEELMTTAYIKLQINNIAISLEKLSRSPGSASKNIASNSNTVGNFQLGLMVEPEAMSITRLRRYVVREVTLIRDLLDIEKMEIVSIHAGASALSNLMAGLNALDMDSECILVGSWAIRLARTLVDTSGDGQTNLWAKLALYLLNQCQQYRGNDDKIRGLQAIEEAYAITGKLRSQCWGEVDFRILYSIVLIEYSELVDMQRSIKMLIEAVRVLEDFLNVHTFTQSDSLDEIKIDRVVHATPSFLDNLFSSAPPTIAITEYAQALQRLGTHLLMDGHSEIGLRLGLLAIAVRRKVAFVYGDGYKAGLANAISMLVQDESASRMPAEKLVDMADECVHLLRKLTEKNPILYSRQLVSVLWKKASTLESLNHDAEAIATLEEVASFTGQIIQDSKMCANVLRDLSDQFRRLKKYDDAVRTGTLAITTYKEGAETQAAIYLNLSHDLQQLRRYKESAEAARKSVELYRRLTMKNPGKWMDSLTEGLCVLALYLAALGNHTEAIIAWRESVSVVDNFLDTHTGARSNVIDRYLVALDIHVYISYALEHEEGCLEVSFTAVRNLRRLSEIYPQSTEIIQRLLWTDFWCAYNMLRVGRLQDAQQYIGDWVDVWSIKPEVIPDSSMMSCRAAMVNLKADILDAQGCTEQALLATKKARDIVRLSVSTCQPSLDMMIESMVLEARLRVDLGNSEEALQISNRALWLSQVNELEPIIALSLHAVAFAALSCLNYNLALEAAREGCNIYASLENRGDDEARGEQDICIVPSLISIQSFAQANLGRYSAAVEDAYRAVDASLEIRDMKSSISATTAERSYIETRGNLSDILLATSNLAQARQICEERSAYFSRRVEKRMGEYRDLVPILRMLGVLCCNEGHHKEGEDAAQELCRIVKMLGSAFPSLQNQVKIRLRKQAKVPILKVLDDMSQKLDCKHQEKVLLLF